MINAHPGPREPRDFKLVAPRQVAEVMWSNRMADPVEMHIDGRFWGRFMATAIRIYDPNGPAEITFVEV